LALVGLGLASLVVAHAWRRYRAGAPIRQAERDLERHFSHFDEKHNAKRELANGVNAVLKRVALVRYPRSEVAELSGSSWTEFLDESAGTDQFSSGMGRVLGDERFAPAFNFDAAALRLAAQYWVEKQRGPIPGSVGLRDRILNIPGVRAAVGAASAGGASAGGASAANSTSRETHQSRLKPLLQERPTQRPRSSEPAEGQAQ
jgi:hypothetical protein